MKHFYTIIICAMAVLVGVVGCQSIKQSGSSTTARAGSGGASGNRGGPMGGMPGGGGPSADFQKTHKYTMQLMGLIGNIGRLEEDGKAALTSQQAKVVLAVLEPLRKQPKLDEIGAKEGLKALQSALTDQQRAAIGAMPAEHQFQKGPQAPGGAPSGPPPGGPPPGGPGGPDGPMADMNPLNPPAGGPGGPDGPGGPNGQAGPGGGNRIDKLMDGLKKKAGNG